MYQSVEAPVVATVRAQRSAKNSKFVATIFASLAALAICGYVAHSGAVQKVAPVSRLQSAEGVAECFTYQGGAIEKGKYVHDIEYQENMRVEFVVKIASDAVFGNVLQMGGKQEDEWPAIFFNKGEPANYLDFTFAKDGETGEAVGRFPIALNEEHAVRVDIVGTDATLYLDGEEQITVAIPDKYKPSAGSIPVYASSDFNNAAKGSISALKICSSASAIPEPEGCGAAKCQKFEGVTELKRDNQIGTFDVTSHQEVRLTVKLSAWTGDWASIFHIGAQNGERQPGIWQCNSNRDCLHFTFNGGSGDQFWYDHTVELNVEYKIHIILESSDARIYLNGELIKQQALAANQRTLREEVPVYASDPWYVASNAEVKDIMICAYE